MTVLDPSTQREATQIEYFGTDSLCFATSSLLVYSIPSLNLSLSSLSHGGFFVRQTFLPTCLALPCLATGYELDDLKLANEEDMDHVEDLIALPHLHEAAILHSLCRCVTDSLNYSLSANRAACPALLYGKFRVQSDLPCSALWEGPSYDPRR